uniref:PH domain-containing protein n=1 Tax=Syphacia muris TaxID=451379 RepID=A0A0N5B172_9BILA
MKQKKICPYFIQYFSSVANNLFVDDINKQLKYAKQKAVLSSIVDDESVALWIQSLAVAAAAAAAAAVRNHLGSTNFSRLKMQLSGIESFAAKVR